MWRVACLVDTNPCPFLVLRRLTPTTPYPFIHSLPPALACCSRCCLFLACLCASRHPAVVAVAVSIAHPAGLVVVPQAPRETVVPAPAAAGGGGRGLRGGAADPATTSPSASDLRCSCYCCCHCYCLCSGHCCRWATTGGGGEWLRGEERRDAKRGNEKRGGTQLIWGRKSEV